ncbi:MAG: hypothetical protein VB112_00370 [Oscillospiraceae bacterium]|nr:hypothetical protein [Oscillospiraceae bacterium]
MKAIKNRLVLYTIYVVAGIVLLFLPALCALAGSDLGGSTAIVSGIGGAVAAMGVVRLVQYSRLYKDPERAEEWYNAYHEERTSFVANKARAWTFYISVFVELAVGIAAMLMGQKLLGQAFVLLACFQGVLSFILYRVLNNKY